MNRKVALIIFVILADTAPVFAMNNYDDPRILLSFKDKSLTPELDILRVKAKISSDNQLIFEVKTRGERINGETGDYFLLQLINGKSYTLLAPINKTKEDKVLVYESTPQSKTNTPSSLSKKLKKLSPKADFSTRRIPHGIEYFISMDWINFGNDFSYDAYTAQASIQGDTLSIDEIYDQAGKGRKEEKRFSAITLLNKLCTTRKIILTE
ncbi:conserved hypothetical protein [Nitrosococcus halophilus Nc 4]|uniref:Uncharacterized protein n=1 Tax=Nitrosococcus halophilus (strain Nc4) TaxID=472759 RepID=D5BZH9_NITHN|nr:hypothetical protein [Nitrosococcus halophilus]ADE16193.1 conserved hypothetical protein [Nitrosococcus halophilus Nc 4]